MKKFLIGIFVFAFLLAGWGITQNTGFTNNRTIPNDSSTSDKIAKQIINGRTFKSSSICKNQVAMVNRIMAGVKVSFRTNSSQQRISNVKNDIRVKITSALDNKCGNESKRTASKSMKIASKTDAKKLLLSNGGENISPDIEEGICKYVLSEKRQAQGLGNDLITNTCSYDDRGLTYCPLDEENLSLVADGCIGWEGNQRPFTGNNPPPPPPPVFVPICTGIKYEDGFGWMSNRTRIIFQELDNGIGYTMYDRCNTNNQIETASCNITNNAVIYTVIQTCAANTQCTKYNRGAVNCVPITRQGTCNGQMPAHSEVKGTNQWMQTWNGTSWTPTYTRAYNGTPGNAAGPCSWKCSAGYTALANTAGQVSCVLTPPPFQYPPNSPLFYNPATRNTACNAGYRPLKGPMIAKDCPMRCVRRDITGNPADTTTPTIYAAWFSTQVQQNLATALGIPTPEGWNPNYAIPANNFINISPWDTDNLMDTIKIEFKGGNESTYHPAAGLKVKNQTTASWVIDTTDSNGIVKPVGAFPVLCPYKRTDGTPSFWGSVLSNTKFMVYVPVAQYPTNGTFKITAKNVNGLEKIEYINFLANLPSNANYY